MITDLFAADISSNNIWNNPTAWAATVATAQRTASGKTVTESSALSLPAYFACIRDIAEDIGKLPLKVYERTGENERRSRAEHPAHRLLHDAPNSDMSAMTFRETLTQYKLGHGNGYAEIIRDQRGTPVELWPIHPQGVEPRRVDGRLVYKVGKRYTRHGKDILIEQENIFHLRGMGDGVQGYSILRLGAETFGITAALAEFAATFFGNNTTIGGILSHPQRLGKDAHDRLRESFEGMHRGTGNAHRAAILEEGMTYSAMGVPPEEAQFLQSRSFQVVDIARWFRMPPHKIQSMDAATFSNIEHQGIEYVGDTVMPHLIAWQQEVKRKLLGLDTDFFAAHTLQALLMADHSARANFYRTMAMMGAMTPNEIRALEDMNPYPGGVGNEPVMQLAMTTLRTIEGAGVESESIAAGPADVQEQAAGLRPLFLEAAERVTRKESRALQRHEKLAASNDTIAQYRAWEGRFYLEHEQYIISEFETLVVMLSRHALPALEAFASDYCFRRREDVNATQVTDIEGMVDDLTQRIIVVAEGQK